MHTMHDEGVEPSYWLLKRGHGRTGRGLVFSLASCIRLHGIGARGHRRFHCVFVACACVCVCVRVGLISVLVLSPLLEPDTHTHTAQHCTP